MSSAAEDETSALFLTEKEMTPLKKRLEEMGWKQPPTRLQCDNSTAVGSTHQIIVSRKSRYWDLRLNWLKYREQGVRIYWDKGSNDYGDYHTKHHPPCHHEAKRCLGYAGAVLMVDF